jgi:hypothetical protein
MIIIIIIILITYYRRINVEKKAIFFSCIPFTGNVVYLRSGSALSKGVANPCIGVWRLWSLETVNIKY